MKILLKNSNIIDPQISLNEITDVLIVDGVITEIGRIKSTDVDKVIDLTGKVIVPGFADVHVHLREPGREDEETILSGSQAAAYGGFTSICCMPNTDPTVDSAEVVNFIKAKARDLIVDVYPIGAVTKNREGKELAFLGEMANSGVVGFSDDGVAVSTAVLLKSALEYSNMFNLPIIEHCEDATLTKGGVMNEGTNSTRFGLAPMPSIAEDLIVSRDILSLEYSGGKVHLAHLSTANAVELLRNAKRKGLNITGEVTPHHLTLTDDMINTYDTNFKMNPPLRTQNDIDKLIEGLKDGTIDVIATDHAPHSIEEKEWEFIYSPFGIIGLETSIGIILTKLYHTNVLSIEEIIYKMSINPRKIFDLKDASIKVGKEANLTILDLNEIWSVDKDKFKSKSNNTPFNGWLLKGRAIGIINNKKMLYQSIENEI